MRVKSLLHQEHRKEISVEIDGSCKVKELPTQLPMPKLINNSALEIFAATKLCFVTAKNTWASLQGTVGNWLGITTSV